MNADIYAMSAGLVHWGTREKLQALCKIWKIPVERSDKIFELANKLALHKGFAGSFRGNIRVLLEPMTGPREIWNPCPKERNNK